MAIICIRCAFVYVHTKAAVARIPCVTNADEGTVGILTGSITVAIVVEVSVLYTLINIIAIRTVALKSIVARTRKGT